MRLVDYTSGNSNNEDDDDNDLVRLRKRRETRKKNIKLTGLNGTRGSGSRTFPVYGLLRSSIGTAHELI